MRRDGLESAWAGQRATHAAPSGSTSSKRSRMSARVRVARAGSRNIWTVLRDRERVAVRSAGKGENRQGGVLVGVEMAGDLVAFVEDRAPLVAGCPPPHRPGAPAAHRSHPAALLVLGPCRWGGGRTLHGTGPRTGLPITDLPESVACGGPEARRARRSSGPEGWSGDRRRPERCHGRRRPQGARTPWRRERPDLTRDDQLGELGPAASSP